MERAEEVQRVRAERLTEALATATRRLEEVERARAGSAETIAALRGEVRAAKGDGAPLMTRLVGPLFALERCLRWLASKAGQAIGMLARQVAFRARGRQ